MVAHKGRTKKQDRVEFYRRHYGTSDTLWCFDWKGQRGHIGCVPAPDLKTAYKRLLLDEKKLGHVWMFEALKKLQKKKLLSKYVTVSKITVTKQLTYIPAEPP